MKPTFTVIIIELANGRYHAVIKSIQENKAMGVNAPNLRLLMSRVSKDIRKRASMLQRFPAPELPRVLKPDEAEILWTPNGH